jgi:hypothetical protein
VSITRKSKKEVDRMVQKKTVLIGLSVFMYLFSNGSASAYEKEPYWDNVLKMNKKERQALCSRILSVASYANAPPTAATRRRPASIPSPQVTAPVGTTAHVIQSAVRSGYKLGKSLSKNGSDDFISYEVVEKIRRENDYKINKACGTIDKGMDDIVTLVANDRGSSLIEDIKIFDDRTTLKGSVDALVRPPFKPYHILEGDYREYNRLYEDKIAEKIAEALEVADKEGNNEAYELLDDILISRYPDLKKQIKEDDNLEFKKW